MASVKTQVWSQLNRAHPLARDLVGAWLFNEGSGATVYDGSGQRNNGTLTNMDPATDWVAGQDGWALDFDGSNDHIIVPDTSEWTNGFTIFVRGMLRTYQTNAGGPDWGSRILYDTRGATDSDLHYLTVVGTSNGLFSVAVNWASTIPSGERVSLSGSICPLNTMFSLCSTCTLTRLSLYENGVFVKYGDFAGAIRQPNAARIGKFADAGLGGYWNGTFQTVMRYNRALSAPEVAALSADPYQMWERPGWRRYWFMAGGIWFPTRKRGDLLAQGR